MTVEDLMRAARLTYTGASNLVEGRNTPRRTSTAERVAGAVGVDPGQLWPPRTPLAAELEGRRMTRRDLARLAGVGESSLKSWAQGNARPCLADAQRVADTLDMPVADLFAEVRPDRRSHPRRGKPGPDLQASGLGRELAARAMTVSDLAQATGMTPEALSKLVSQDRTPHSTITAARLAAALDLDPNRLWPELRVTPLAAELARQDLTARDLAARAGVHENTLTSWLNGRSRPQAEQAYKVAEALRVPSERLFNHLPSQSDSKIEAERRREVSKPPEPRLLTVDEVLDARPTGDPDWSGRAACGNADPERWWPSPEQQHDTFARGLCASCSVVGDCRDYFLNANWPAGLRDEADRGIWAGLNGRHLRAVARQRAQSATTDTVSARLIATQRDQARTDARTDAYVTHLDAHRAPNRRTM